MLEYKYLIEVNSKDVIKHDMKKWLPDAFEIYNKLAEHMVKINMRDSDIKREFGKIDKAIDAIVKIANRKGYFK